MNKIVEKPRLIGCYNCSSIPTTILDKNRKIDICGMVSLKITGQETKWFLDGEYQGKPLTVKRIMKKWGKKIKKEYHSYLWIGSMMHGETYEYDKKTDNWYLIDQDRGIA